MNQTPGGSSLQCPQCYVVLAIVGSKVERIHPVARFITHHYTGIVVGWGLLTPAILYLFARGQTPVQMKTVGFAWVALMSIPSLVMFFLIRAFSLYRVTQCPHCGYREVKKLGRSPTA